ncbi:MAG: hypothetical protein H8D80_00245 [Proteobacteria bacterium]|nr:hypothetical protein [Pseudomonadota bacterium]
MYRHNINEQVVTALVAFKFLKLMTQDFEDTDAFKLGIVDENGKILKKRKDLKTSEEESAYTIFHTLVWNIKKLLKKVPGLKSKIGSYVASLYLLKEAVNEKYGSEDAEKTVEFIINHLIENGVVMDIDTLFEGQFNDTINGGTYIATVEMVLPSYGVVGVGDNITIKEDSPAFVHFLGIPLYKGIHENSGEEVVVDSSSISSPEMVAGMAVFNVDSVPHEMVHGHQTYERWSKDKFGSLKNDLKDTIKKYSHRNKGKTIALRSKDGIITPFKKGRGK